MGVDRGNVTDVIKNMKKHEKTRKIHDFRQNHQNRHGLEKCQCTIHMCTICHISYLWHMGKQVHTYNCACLCTHAHTCTHMYMTVLKTSIFDDFGDFD